MGIKAGEDTFYQAQRGIVQDGLIFNVDSAVDASYNGGTTLRDLQNTTDGTFSNSPTFNKKKGGAIQFDGTNQIINFTADSITPPFPFSINCWVLFPSAGSTEPIFWSSLVSNYHIGFKIGKGSTNYVYTQIGVGSGGGSGSRKDKTGTTALSADTWYNICCLFEDVADHTIYLNNQDDGGSYGGGATTFSYGTGKAPVIGRQGWNVYSEMELGCLQIYNRALTSDEVARNYNATRHRFGV
jgi:hypothetical protein